MARKKSATTYETSYPVEFRSFGGNKESVRIGLSVKLNREVTLSAINRHINGAALQCSMKCDPNSSDDADGQTTLDGNDIEIDTMAECRGFSVRGNTLSFSLQIVKSAVTLEDLSRFAFCRGTFAFNRIGDAEPRKPGRPAKDEGDDEGDEDGDDNEGGLLN